MSPGTSRGFPDQGPDARQRCENPERSAHPSESHWFPSSASARVSASRLRPVHQAGRCAGPRALPQPDPLGHLSSRDRRDVGWSPDFADRRSGRSLTADRAIPPHEAGSRRPRGPRSVRPAFAERPRPPVRCKRRSHGPNRSCHRPLSWSGPSRPGTNGRTFCSRSALTRGQGPLPSPFREETMRSAAPEVPSIEALPSPAVCPCVQHRQLRRTRFRAPARVQSRCALAYLAFPRAGCCPQLFTSLWTSHDAFFVPRLAGCLDGLPVARARSPLRLNRAETRRDEDVSVFFCSTEQGMRLPPHPHAVQAGRALANQTRTDADTQRPLRLLRSERSAAR